MPHKGGGQDCWRNKTKRREKQVFLSAFCCPTRLVMRTSRSWKHVSANFYATSEARAVGFRYSSLSRGRKGCWFSSQSRGRECSVLDESSSILELVERSQRIVGFRSSSLSRGRRGSTLARLCLFSPQLAETAMQQREIAVLRRAELRTTGSLRKPKTPRPESLPCNPCDLSTGSRIENSFADPLATSRQSSGIENSFADPLATSRQARGSKTDICGNNYDLRGKAQGSKTEHNNLRSPLEERKKRSCLPAGKPTGSKQGPLRETLLDQQGVVVAVCFIPIATRKVGNCNRRTITLERSGRQCADARPFGRIVDILIQRQTVL